MRHNNAHGANVQDLLYESIATLVRDAHEWSNARGIGSYTELVCVFDGQRSVLKIDEQRVVSRCFGDMNDRGVGGDLDAESGADRIL